MEYFVVRSRRYAGEFAFGHLRANFSACGEMFCLELPGCVSPLWRYDRKAGSPASPSRRRRTLQQWTAPWIWTDGVQPFFLLVWIRSFLLTSTRSLVKTDFFLELFFLLTNDTFCPCRVFKETSLRISASEVLLGYKLPLRILEGEISALHGWDVGC